MLYKNINSLDNHPTFWTLIQYSRGVTNMIDSVNEFTKLKEQEREARKRIILDEAERIFAEKSFEEVNVRDLAQRVGISPGSIYRYFPDKEALYVEVALRGFSHALDIFKSEVAQDNVTLEKAAVDYIEKVFKHYEYFRMMHHCIIDEKFKSKEAQKKLKSITSEFFKKTDSLFGAEETQESRRLKSHLLFAALNGFVFTFLSSNVDRSSEESVSHIKTLTGILVRILRET